MALQSPLTVQPYDYIADSNGRPLDKGQIYIGVAGQDPEFYQIPVYLDAAMTKLIDQPIRTNDGFVDFAGSLSELYASAEVYSVKVLDKEGRKVLYKGDMTRKNLMSDALADLNQSIIDMQTAAQVTLNAAVNSANTEVAQTVSLATAAIDTATTKSNKAATDADAAIKTLFENGGLPATPFATKALMTASALADGKYAMVTDDTVNNGLYVKTAGAWVKSAYDPFAQAKNYTDLQLTKSSGTFDTLAQLTASPLIDGAFGLVANDTATKNGYYKKSAGVWAKATYQPYKEAKDYIDNSQTIVQKYDSSYFTIENTYIQGSTGNALTLANSKATDFIEITANATYSYKLSTPNGGGGSFYDKNKKLISSFAAGSSGSVESSIVAPANAHYVRLGNRSDNATPYLMGYGVYNIDKINAIIDRYPKSELLQENYGSEAFVFANSLVNGATGNIESSSTFTRTDYIAIAPNTEYEIFSWGSGSGVSVWFDKNKKRISSFNPVPPMVVTSPKNASFVILTSQTVHVGNAYIKTVNPTFNTNKLMKTVNAHLPLGKYDMADIVKAIDNPMQYETTVKSKKDLNAVNGITTTENPENAFPAGRRVYDKSLRSEVYADGMFWRLPDGRAADTVQRTYVYPDWDETRAKLPTYAKNYSKIYTVSESTLSKWSSSAEISGAKLSNKYGDKRVCLTHYFDKPRVIQYFKSDDLLTLNATIIFDYYTDFTVTSDANVFHLCAADGSSLFSIQLSYLTTGANPKLFSNREELVQTEIKVSDMTPTFVGASLADVKYIGFTVVAKSSAKSIGRLYIGDIETVTFKPKFILRFDDQRKSVYENAFPIMQQYGFKGLIAVITGNPNLANHPDASTAPEGMTKAQLLEVQALGWDLTSHTHTHMNYNIVSDEYMRENYRLSRDYLRNELNSGMIASSCLVSPLNNRNERAAKIQREFFDCTIGGGHLNSHMPRQPTGSWEKGSLWALMGAYNGDGLADTVGLKSLVDSTISRGGWGIVMLHDVLPTKTTYGVTIEQFQDLCAYLDSKRDEIEVVTITEVVSRIRPL